MTCVLKGERFRMARNKRGLTQEQLGDLVHVSDATINRYENEKSDPDTKMLGQLAAELATTTDYLLGLTDDPRPSQVRETAAVELYDDVASLTPDELREWRGYADWLRERRKRKGPPHNLHPTTPQT